MQPVISQRDLRAVIALADELNFGRAAERLGVAQPQLSLMIKRAERATGFEIFRRRPNVRLTSPGEIFLDAVRQSEVRIERAIKEGRELASGKRGRIRLGFIDAAMFTELTSSLVQFRTTNSDVTLELLEGSTSGMLRALGSGEVDLVITRQTAEETGLTSVPIMPDELLVALWDGHPAATGGSVRLANLQDNQFIWFDRSTAPVHYDRLMRACHLAGLHPNIGQTVDSWSAACALIRSRFGIALATAASARMAYPGVTYAEIEDSTPDVSFWLTYDLRKLTPAAVCLAKLLKTMKGRHRGSEEIAT
jgi:DNA-binding transcriptional LysR family regulator